MDAGLLPHGDGALLGELSSFAPGLSLHDPAPAKEQELRQAIATSGLPKTSLRRLAAGIRSPLAFSRTGIPLAAPLMDAAGLFGFASRFAQVAVIAAGSATAQGQLEKPQVWQHSR